jgi:peptidyl-prolyl cis-trans isomerase B (cyclophilin B)
MKRSLLALLVLVAGVAWGQDTDPKAKNPVVVLKTNQGDIKIELYQDKAPETVKNFLKYVDDKHYDGTTFHRVIGTFMIQGGGFEKGFNKATTLEEAKKKEKKTRDPIKNESTNGLQNKKYTLAMARTPKPDSATSQFFINVKDNDFLDRANARDRVGYCVFGKVIDGTDVVDKIKGVKTKSLIADIFEDVPVEEVVIESARREKK